MTAEETLKDSAHKMDRAVEVTREEMSTVPSS
jgi:hypothetical protein